MEKKPCLWFGLDSHGLNGRVKENLEVYFQVYVFNLPWYDKTCLKSLKDNPDYGITILTDDNIKENILNRSNVE